MARVSMVEKENAGPMVKESYEKAEASSGSEVINLFKVMGHCPYIGLNFRRLGNSILRGEVLPADLRELAILRVGDLAKSEYEFTKHVVIGKGAGVRQEQIDEIGNWPASKEFDERERAVLAYTDEVAQNVSVKDETFNELSKYFDDHAIVELTAAIGYYGMVCRILVSLQIELE